MPRDYKDYKRVPRPRERPRRRGAPGWVWGFAGLVAGLSVAAYVYLAGYRAPAPVSTARPPASTARAESSQRSADLPPAPPAPKPATPAADAKPRFEFYTMLPEMEEPVQEPAAPRTPGSAGTPGESYLLQVASFRTYQEADRLKARLSLMGLEASIQSVTTGAKPSHRVRVGPYSDMAKLNEARRRLREHAFEPIVLKGKT